MKRPKNEGNDWNRVIRCDSCGTVYKAKPLLDIERFLMVGQNEDAQSMGVGYNECPHCYALFLAEFSLS